jgi:manganese transport protein
MGEFVNPLWLKILAWFTAAVIAVLNAVLLYYLFRHWGK